MAKRVVLDDAHLDVASKLCQNRKCTSLAHVSVDVTTDRGDIGGIPMCRHCARLLLRLQLNAKKLQLAKKL